MSSMIFDACINMSHHGLLHPFKDPWVAVDSLTGIHNAVAMCLFIINRSYKEMLLGVPTGKYPADSNLMSMEAMQWIFLYLSIDYNRCH
jgi:hypothetical protein